LLLFGSLRLNVVGVGLFVSLGFVHSLEYFDYLVHRLRRDSRYSSCSHYNWRKLVANSLITIHSLVIIFNENEQS
ncbi:hypothetical protein, partial [Enterococcus faecalis]|uniref:hypothetical protein n=1 Tax=Enterococcus faecalis TaxID=1351 RepID=UPI001E52FD98